jgi:hypothetical protein
VGFYFIVTININQQDRTLHSHIGGCGIYFFCGTMNHQSSHHQSQTLGKEPQLYKFSQVARKLQFLNGHSSIQKLKLANDKKPLVADGPLSWHYGLRVIKQHYCFSICMFISQTCSLNPLELSQFPFGF